MEDILPLDSHTIWIGCFGGLGVLFAMQNCKTVPQIITMLNALIVAAAAALVCGRLGFVLLNATYFKDHGRDIINFGQTPGISAQFALLGCYLGGWLMRRAHADFLRTLIFCVICVGIGASFGCIGAGCGYGREVFPDANNLVWGMSVDWPDAYNLPNPRLPTQLMMSGCLIFSGFVSLKILSLHQWANPLLIFLFCIASSDFGLQFMRADAVLMLVGLRLPQWLDIGMMLGGLSWLAHVRWDNR